LGAHRVETSRLPHFLDNRLTDEGETVDDFASEHRNVKVRGDTGMEGTFLILTLRSEETSRHDDDDDDDDDDDYITKQFWLSCLLLYSVRAESQYSGRS
jgi:hypothetical protein